MKKTAPYGSWPSPISAQLVASATPTIDQPVIDNKTTDGANLYWLESRADEGGRNVIVQRDDNGDPRDVLPRPYSAASRVHEYGGACYTVYDHIIYFVNRDDQQIHRLDTGQSDSKPQAITPANRGYRFADFCVDPTHHRLLCVCEHHDDKDAEPKNFIATLSLTEPHHMTTLVDGDDFYAYPRISPAGAQLCWLSWNHPSMPWYGNELWQATVNNEGELSGATKIAGSKQEAIFQPQWSPSGQLYFVSDRSGWWNLYRYESSGQAVAICTREAEFATPLWTLGMSTYTFLGNNCVDDCGNRIICCYTQNGLWYLARINISVGTGSSELIPVQTHCTQISAVAGCGDTAWFVGASADTGNQLFQLDTITGHCSTVREFAVPVPAPDKGIYSKPQNISFATTHGDRANAFYYPPCNTSFQARTGDKPPLIVICHGGPTGATSTALNLKIQFWTSRGFAVLDINYRGSTGYGRHYRELLDGKWGISDVEDVVWGGRYVIDHGLADPDKLAIRGSSAGGYTVLAALTFHQLFKAGASYYGIGDLEALARDTHKFESQYLERLVGTYPAQADIYQARSPVHHIDRLTCPVIFFQGLDDKVVPANQAESMVSALQKQGLPAVYITFPGEGHGFRKAENIAQALTQELQFYREVFDIKITDGED